MTILTPEEVDAIHAGLADEPDCNVSDLIQTLRAVEAENRELHKQNEQLREELSSRPFEVTGDQLAEDMLVWIKRDDERNGQWLPISRHVLVPINTDPLRRYIVKRKPVEPAGKLVEEG